MSKDTRAISWIKAAHKEFGKFPQGAQTIILRALTIAAEGSKGYCEVDEGPRRRRY